MRNALAILCCGLLAACSNVPYKQPPSTAAAQQSVNTARGNVDSSLAGVTDTISENRSAMEHNRRARTNAELIDNKASVIRKYWQ